MNVSTSEESRHIPRGAVLCLCTWHCSSLSNYHLVREDVFCSLHMALCLLLISGCVLSPGISDLLSNAGMCAQRREPLKKQICKNKRKKIPSSLKSRAPSPFTCLQNTSKDGCNTELKASFGLAGPSSGSSRCLALAAFGFHTELQAAPKHMPAACSPSRHFYLQCRGCSKGLHR